MKYLAIATAAAAICGATPAFAQSACASFRIPSNQNKVDYSPLGGAAVTTFNVQVDGANKSVQSIRFILVDTDSAAQGGQGLGQYGPAQYSLGAASNLTRGFGYGSDQPNTVNSALATIPGNSGRDNVSFQLTIPAGQQARGGTHVQDLVVRYECLDAGGNLLGLPQQQATPLTVEARVPSYVSATIDGKQGGLIDFGTISASSNLTKDLYVNTLATLPYDVLIDSEYGGMLKRGANQAAGIGYSMTYDGAAVNDGQRVVCPRPANLTGRLDRFAVTLKQGDVAAAASGNYSDTVTLTFTARDIPELSGSCLITP